MYGSQHKIKVNITVKASDENLEIFCVNDGNNNTFPRRKQKKGKE